MIDSPTPEQSPQPHKPQPMVDLLISILIPSFILMKMSDAEQLGASGALIVALAFPPGWGLFELLKYKKFKFIALLGLISVDLNRRHRPAATGHTVAGNKGSDYPQIGRASCRERV